MDVWGWMADLVANYGYFGAFVISIFGNFTIFFPVPFTITIYAFVASLNPAILGLACGLGSTIGEFSAYLVGLGGRRVIGERYEERLESAKRLLKRYGAAIIFLFALLPLPDDAILIPLGVLRYDLKKALVAAFLHFRGDREDTVDNQIGCLHVQSVGAILGQQELSLSGFGGDGATLLDPILLVFRRHLPEHRIRYTGSDDDD